MKTLVLLAMALSMACQTVSAYHENQLFAFIGKRMDVTKCTDQENDPATSMDSCAKATFKVLSNYYGHLNTDTVEFLSYNHYAEPSFTEYGLVYLTYKAGRFYECKYQFTPLYKTRNGRWAAPYDANDYEHPFNNGTSIKPIPMDFVPPAEVDLSNFPPETISRYFPEPYYEVKGKVAVAKYGNYVDELFQLKRNGVLKAREYF